MTLAEISITETWAALGGAPLKHGRAPAFWREGKNLSVHVDDQHGFFDHVTGKGGGTLALVMTALGVPPNFALRWLEVNLGLDPRKPLPAREFQARERKRAEVALEADDAVCFGIAAAALTETVLETMNNSDLRRELFTLQLIAARGSGAALLEEYRAWRAIDPDFTMGLVCSGRDSRARMQQRLALFIRLMESQDAA